MVYPEKKIILKNGKTALLRSAAPEDAAQLAGYLKRLAEETEFTSSIPSECSITVEEEAQKLKEVQESSGQLMLVCEIEGQIAGALEIRRMPKWKANHRADFGIGLYRDYWGLGIGTALLQEALDWARTQGICQVELEALESNERGLRLYQKMGFREVGRIPSANRMQDGSFQALVMMVCSL